MNPKTTPLRVRRVAVVLPAELVDRLTAAAMARAQADAFPSLTEWCRDNQALITKRFNDMTASGQRPSANLANVLYREARGPARMGRPAFHDYLSEMVAESVSAWLDGQETQSRETQRVVTKKKAAKR